MCSAIGAATRATRWCPTAEQVLLLEGLYKGGLTNPTAAQIHQIVAHLSQFGKIQGKNVFYWFQNHKARDKQKIRKKLVTQQQQLVGFQIIQCSQRPNSFTDHHCCRPELAFHSNSSSVFPFNNDERMSATVSKPHANAKCCGVLGMRDGGWRSVIKLARPLPEQPPSCDSRHPALVTLDLFPVTPSIKEVEGSNNLSSNYSHVSNVPHLLNPNLILGATGIERITPHI